MVHQVLLAAARAGPAASTPIVLPCIVEAASADALTRCLLPAADSVTPRIRSPSDSLKKQPPRESGVAGDA